MIIREKFAAMWVEVRSDSCLLFVEQWTKKGVLSANIREILLTASGIYRKILTNFGPSYLNRSAQRR